MKQKRSVMRKLFVPLTFKGQIVVIVILFLVVMFWWNGPGVMILLVPVTVKFGVIARTRRARQTSLPSVRNGLNALLWRFSVVRLQLLLLRLLTRRGVCRNSFLVVNGRLSDFFFGVMVPVSRRLFWLPFLVKTFRWGCPVVFLMMRVFLFSSGRPPIRVRLCRLIVTVKRAVNRVVVSWVTGPGLVRVVTLFSVLIIRRPFSVANFQLIRLLVQIMAPRRTKPRVVAWGPLVIPWLTLTRVTVPIGVKPEDVPRI